jgi:hypothetical protein
MTLTPIQPTVGAICDALRILQDPTIGSPEACERAIDVLTRALAVREDTERPGEIERLREGLERACDVSFTVGLLRLRARDDDDAELAEWGEKLKAQLEAIREVLSPGTAAFMADQRAQEVVRDTEQEHKPLSINEATGDPIDEGYVEHAWAEPDTSDGLDDEREGRGR